MYKLENISKEKLNEISNIIGEAFVTNCLFNNLGDIKSRTNIVKKYMDIYVKWAYKNGYLYSNDDNTAFIGLAYSWSQKILPKIIMILKTIKVIPIKKYIKFMQFVSQIKDGDIKYSSKKHLEVLMVCVKKDFQHKGKTRELIDFAKDMAKKENVPCIINTDMEEYSLIYQHYGFELYNKIKADNGVTRFNLVFR